MSDTYSIKCDGSEVGRVSAERIECGKRVADKTWRDQTLVDDPKLLRIMRDSKAIAVFYVSSAENVTVERASE